MSPICPSEAALRTSRSQPAPAREHPELTGSLARAAKASDLRLTAWVILCHNSGLAATRPDAAMENCFGDPSGHGLCPSNPLVRRYALELCQQVLEIGIFDELFVESAAYLVGGHGHPHELWAVRDDPATRYLRALCFCPSCVHNGEERGIDAADLRDWVSGTLHRTWNSPLTLGREPDPGDELSGMLVSRPDLAAWTAMRCQVVAELVGDLAVLAHRHGSRLSTALGIFARPAALGWMEGLDPSRLAGVSDKLVATAYYPSPGAVARDPLLLPELCPTRPAATRANTLAPSGSRRRRYPYHQDRYGQVGRGKGLWFL